MFPWLLHCCEPGCSPNPCLHPHAAQSAMACALKEDATSRLSEQVGGCVLAEQSPSPAEAASLAPRGLHIQPVALELAGVCMCVSKALMVKDG